MTTATLQEFIPQKRYYEKDYLAALIALLPPGSLWRYAIDKVSVAVLDNQNADTTNGILTVILSVIAKELSRIDDSVQDMWKQSMPGTATDMLPDWESVLGLPENFQTPPSTIAERQDIAHAKYYADYNKGMSAEFYITYAAQLGWTITIDGASDISRPFFVAPVGVDPYNIGSRVEDRLNDSSQLQTIIFNVIAGPSDTTQLQNIINTKIPAHVVVVWNIQI